MFAKLKEKIQKEGGSVTEGDRSLPALPGHASPLRLSTSGSPVQSPLARDRSVEDFATLVDENVTIDSSKEDLFARLQKRTEQCKKLEARMNEYLSSIKDQAKKTEKLETFIEKQQDALSKRTQELTDKHKEEIEHRDKEKLELVNKLKLLEEKHKDFYKKEEEKEEIEGFTSQELGKLKHMVILKEEELSKCQLSLSEKSKKLDLEENKVKELSAKLSELQEKLLASETARQKLEEDSVEHGKIVSALTKERITLEQSLTDAKSQLTELNKNLSGLQASHADMENTHQALVRNFEQHKNKSSQQLEEKADQVLQLQDRIQLLEQRERDHSLTGDERILALEKEREGLERKLTETQEQLTQVKSSWSEKISHLEEQISHLNLKIVEDREELAAANKNTEHIRDILQKEISTLKEKLAAAEKQAQDNLNLVDCKEGYFKKERLELETEISKLRLEKIDLDTNLRAKMTSLESQITALESAKAQEVALLEQQLENNKKQLINLETTKTGVDHQLTDIQSKCTHLQTKVEDLEKTEASLKSALEEEKKQLQESQNQNKQLTEELMNIKGKMGSMQENSKSTASEITEINKEKDELMLRNAELSQKLTALQTSSVAEKAGLEEELRSSKEVESTLQQQCDDLRLQVGRLTEANTEQASSTEEVARLQDAITVLEEQLSDRNKAMKKQELKINDLKKTLQRELKVQALPNDDPIDPKVAALTPPPARKNSASRSAHLPDIGRTRRQNSHERALPTSDTGQGIQGYSENSNSSHDFFLGQSPSHGHGFSVKGAAHRLPGMSDHATISVNDPHSANSNSYGPGHSNFDKSRTSYRDGGIDMRYLEKDVNFQYLKHVVMKFVLSREHEALQLIKAISLLLRFSPEEQKLMKDTLEWKMSWFGGSQPPAVLKGHANKIIPPSY